MLSICPIINGTRVFVINNTSFPIVYKLAYWGFLIPGTSLAQGETKIENIPPKIECPMTCDFVYIDKGQPFRTYCAFVTVKDNSDINIVEDNSDINITEENPNTVRIPINFSPKAIIMNMLK